MAKRPGDDDGLDAWMRAMADVKPLKGKARTAPPPPPRAKPREAPMSEDDYGKTIGQTIVFDVEMEGDVIRGRAASCDRKLLSQLATGRLPIEEEIDLHDFTRAEAQPLVVARLTALRREGKRIVLVITGRGKSTDGAGVLRTAMVRWLTEPPLDRVVLAFTNAQRQHGGAGAIYVMLRRIRRG